MLLLQATALPVSLPTPQGEGEAVKWIMTLSGALIVGFLLWLLKEVHDIRDTMKSDSESHNQKHEELMRELSLLREAVALHESFIKPLNMVFQQHLATALFKTNPFSTEENEATRSYLSEGAEVTPLDDLFAIRGGIKRVLVEDIVPGKEMDAMIYGGILAGVEYEMKRRLQQVLDKDDPNYARVEAALAAA